MGNCPSSQKRPEVQKYIKEGDNNKFHKMRDERRESVISAPPGPRVELFLEGLECVCPTDPTGDEIMIFFVVGISICAIGGGVFGTFVPRAIGIDRYEPLCTASAATIFTVLYTTMFDSLGLLERAKEELEPRNEVNGIFIKGIMTADQYTVFQDEGELEVEEWKSEDEDQIVFRVNEEPVLQSTCCNEINVKSGDFVPINKTFYPKNNRFTFELEEWDFQAANNQLVPSPTGIYRVDQLKSTWDFSRNSKNPGLYFVSTANKSIYVLYGRLEVKDKEEPQA